MLSKAKSASGGTKEKSNKTLIIILAIIVGLIILFGIGGGACYYLYKIGTAEEEHGMGLTPEPWEPSEVDKWLTYTNSRFGFLFKYPSTFEAHESTNGDGVSLTSSSPPISINVYGTANSQKQTLDEYLNAERADLFKGAEGAEEVSALDTTLGGVAAQGRQWHYVSSADGSDTILEQVTALKGNTFYTIQMIIGYTSYSEYSLMFDEILATYTYR